MEEKIVTVLNEMSEYLSIAQMKKLQEVILKAFAENEHLGEIYFAGRSLRKVYPATFEGIRKTIKILVLPAEKAKIEKLLQKALREGKVLIDLI